MREWIKTFLKRPWWVVLVVVGLAAIIHMVYLRVVEGRPWARWTEFGDYTGPGGKTFWDLAELLVIPVFLVGVAGWLNYQDHKNEREETRERVQETALQSYLDKMTELIVRYDLKETCGRIGRPGDAALQQMARTRTIIVLRTLNASRRDLVFHFLRDTGLHWFLLEAAVLQRMDLSHTDMNSVNLRDADLHRSNLKESNLSEANLLMVNLSGVDLSRANLSKADLSGVNLSGAILRNADLSSVNPNKADLLKDLLVRPDLSDANLRGANLESANLARVNLSRAVLIGANLRNAILTGANLSGANLRKVNLKGAHLVEANLTGADLRKANLAESNLLRDFPFISQTPEADITGADFKDVKNLDKANVTPEQLAKAKNVPC
jgi:uncharacterized protein YjbI with pentapeptide repeats